MKITNAKSTISDKAKIILLQMKKKDYEKEEIIGSLSNDELKFQYLNLFEDDYYKVNIIETFTNDELKLKCIGLVKEINLRTMIIQSIHSDEIKLENASLIGDLESEINIIKSLSSDFLKKKKIEQMESGIAKSEIIASLSSDKEKLMYLSNSHNEIEKAKIITSFLSDELKLKKLSMLEKDETKMDVIMSLRDEHKREKSIILLETDFCRMKIIQSLSNEQLIFKNLTLLSDDQFKIQITRILEDDQLKLKALSFFNKNFYKATLLSSLEDDNLKLNNMDKISDNYDVVLNSCLSDSLKFKLLKKIPLDYLTEKNPDFFKLIDCFDSAILMDKAVDYLESIPVVFDFNTTSTLIYHSSKSIDVVEEKSIDEFKKQYLIRYGKLPDEIMSLVVNLFENNLKLFMTLNMEILNTEIINTFDFSVFQRISMYKEVQKNIIEVHKNPKMFKLFTYALQNIEKYVYISPMIEIFSENLLKCSNGFIECVYIRLMSGEPLNDLEKSIISHMILNPTETKNVQSFNDIKNKKDNDLEKALLIVEKENASCTEIKDTYCQLLLGFNLNKVEELIYVFGNDAEDLLLNYNSNQSSEKKALGIIVLLKKLITEQDTDLLKNLTVKLIENFKNNEELAIMKYNQSTTLENELRKAYGKELVGAINKDTGTYVDEKNKCKIGRHIGQEYTVREITGEFTKIVSLLGAYRESDVDGDMYDQWHTTEYSENHALCFSLINQSNPATAASDKRTGIIISFKDFPAEALLSAAPYDVHSATNSNTISFIKPPKFYTTKNMADNTRNLYSEYNIEVSDALGEKIPIDSIICFEQVDQASINASIELSKKYGRVIPVELIDRGKLAEVEFELITKSFKLFMDSDLIEIGAFENVITKFLNIRNALKGTKLENKICNEGNFSENNLDRMVILMIKSLRGKITYENIDEIREILNYATKHTSDRLEIYYEIENLKQIFLEKTKEDFKESVSQSGTYNNVLKINQCIEQLHNELNANFIVEEENLRGM